MIFRKKMTYSDNMKIFIPIDSNANEEKRNLYRDFVFLNNNQKILEEEFFMKVSKILIAIVLTFLIVFSMVGCGKLNQSANTKEQKNLTSVKSDNKNFPDKLNNPNITILSHKQEEEGVTVDVIEAQEKFEEKYGGKVTFIITVWNEIPTKIISMISSGDAPDYYPVADTGQVFMGLLQPLDNYADFNDPVWTENGASFYQYKYNGKIYGFPTIPNPFVVLYNKTLFENNGLKTPKEFYEEGKWDWNTLMDLAVKLTQDTNRDGNIDQWGLFSWETQVFPILNGANIVELADNGDVILAVKRPEMIEALQFVQDAANKYKCMPAALNFDRRKAFSEGNLAINIDRFFTLRDPQRDGSKFEYDMAPLPPRTIGGTAIAAAGASTWGIPVGAKNPEGAAAFAFIKKRITNDMDRQNLKEYLSDENIQLVSEIRKNTSDINFAKSFADLIKVFKNKVYKDVVTKAIPPVSAVEQYIPEMQAEIDLTLKSINVQ